MGVLDFSAVIFNNLLPECLIHTFRFLSLGKLKKDRKLPLLEIFKHPSYTQGYDDIIKKNITRCL